MQTTGDETKELAPVPTGLGHSGYMLFSSKGRWQVTLAQGSSTELGVLLVEVV